MTTIDIAADTKTRAEDIVTSLEHIQLSMIQAAIAEADARGYARGKAESKGLNTQDEATKELLRLLDMARTNAAGLLEKTHNLESVIEEIEIQPKSFRVESTRVPSGSDPFEDIVEFLNENSGKSAVDLTEVELSTEDAQDTRRVLEGYSDKCYNALCAIEDILNSMLK